MSCGKVCEEGLRKVKLEQEVEESWERSAKKGVEGSDANRNLRGAHWLKFEVALAVRVWGKHA